MKTEINEFQLLMQKPIKNYFVVRDIAVVKLKTVGA